MTRAEFLKNILHVDPEDILIPLQNTQPIPVCIHAKCYRRTCNDCKYGRSYWNSEITLEDITYIITAFTKAYRVIVKMNGSNYEKVDKKNIHHTCGSCKFEYRPEYKFPCSNCTHGDDIRPDLWEEKEDE